MEMKSTMKIQMDDWHKQEFDSNGNKTYFENSAGDWYKYEYDLNGKEIYYENSDGVWCKYEYDSKGNQIYYENSFGRIEDNRPTCEGKVVEIEGKKYKLTSL
jgi:hypothetical protein